LGVVLEREVPVGSEHEILEEEPILSEQVLGLVEPEFPRRRRRRQPLHRGASHGLEGAEVRMMLERDPSW
jgi:hypothetical protein